MFGAALQAAPNIVYTKFGMASSQGIPMKKYLVKLNQEQRQEFWRTKQTFVALIRKMEEAVYLDGNNSGVYLIPADGGLVARIPRLSVQYDREEVREWW